MKKSAILINGVSLPHHVIDKAVQQAGKNGRQLKVVFIYENTDDKEYPGELASKADISESNAVKNLEDLVQHNAEYVETNFMQHDVQHEIVVLRNPSIEEVAASLSDADKIFVDHETFMHPDEFAYVNFSFEDLEEQIKTKIEWCKRD
jgi:DNA-binding MarR family transcriptional regulator